MTLTISTTHGDRLDAYARLIGSTPREVVQGLIENLPPADVSERGIEAHARAVARERGE